MKRQIVVASVLAAALATPCATSLAASGPKLSITVIGAPLVSLAANLKLHEAATDTPLTIDAKLSGRLPAGAKVRLSVRTVASAPFKLAKGTVAFHNGHAVLHVDSSTAATVTYRLVVVSSSGRTIAKSGNAGVFWIAPPTELVVTDDGSQADLNIRTGAITCFPQSAASGTACTNGGGSSSGGQEPLGAFVNPTDMPPGASIALFFNGAQICTSDVFNGTCQQEIVMPTVAATTVFPAVAQYTSPSGAKTTVTLLISDFP